MTMHNSFFSHSICSICIKIVVIIKWDLFYASDYQLSIQSNFCHNILIFVLCQ